MKEKDLKNAIAGLEAIMGKKFVAYEVEAKETLDYIYAKQHRDIIIPLLAHWLVFKGLTPFNGQSNEDAGIPQEKWQELSDRFMERLTSLSLEIVEGNYESQEVASLLAKELANYPKDDERNVFAAMFIQIPGMASYRKIPDFAVMMDANEFKLRHYRLMRSPVYKEVIATVRNAKYKTRSAMWSVILHHLDSVEDKRDRALLMTLIRHEEELQESEEKNSDILGALMSGVMKASLSGEKNVGRLFTEGPGIGVRIIERDCSTCPEILTCGKPKAQTFRAKQNNPVGYS